nr:site-specific DNA-methyltransferase [Neisseria brasiliensis]
MDFHDTQNVFIEAENLEALKILQKSYAGKVKMIYIDPPYNTGNDSFIYPDKFAETRDEYAKRVGDKDQDGYLLRDGAFAGAWRKNSKDNGHYHSNWLSMMLPRLHLAKTLLREDGVIFISIDDNEQAQLKLLCDEVFGAENFVAELVVIVKPEGRRYGYFAKTHDYVLVYSKNINSLNLNEILAEGNEHKYADKLGGFSLKGLRNRNVQAFNSKNRPNLRYPFYVNTKNQDENGFMEVSTVSQNGFIKVEASIIDGLESVWRWGRDKAEKEKHNLLAYKGNDGEIRIFQKERKLSQTAKTVLFDKEFISNKGTKELQDLIGKGFFDFPKPVALIDLFLEIGSNSNDLILDFFSGSGTTAHAVMQLNAEDGGNRRYICVQLPEETDENSEARKAGFANIAEIAKERIRRAGAQIRRSGIDARQDRPSENADTAAGAVSGIHARPTVDTGFKVFKLTESHFKQWRRPLSGSLNEQQQLALLEEFQNIVHEHASVENMAYELMLRLGFELTDSIEFVDHVVWLNNAAQTRKTALLLDTVNQAVLDEVRAQSPKKVFVLDKAFAGDDALKTNAALQFKDANIDFETL